MDMKNILLLFGLFLSLNVFSQEIKMSKENTISEEEINAAQENLDLEVVAEVFGESSDLEDFEKRLNDPNSEISNLDLNKDGEVDYLRVVEKEEGDQRTIYVQAAVSNDSFKNVASLVVVKDENDEVNVKVIGDEAIYGANYVIVPAYRRVPPVITWFWKPSYRVWVSPYRYGVYPSLYRPRVVVAPATRVTTRRRARVRTRTAIRRW